MPRTLTIQNAMTSREYSQSQPEESSGIDDFTELLLQTRRIYLKKRQPRSKYVKTLRNKLLAGVARPFQMLLAVGESDIEDGAPISIVLGPWYAGIAELRAVAAKRDVKRGTPWVERMNAAMQREPRAQARLTEAQLRAAVNMDDAANLVALRTAVREYRAVYEEMESLIDQRFAVERLVA